MMSRNRGQRELSNRLWQVAILFAVLTSFLATGAAQTTVPVVTGDARVDKLLSEMTLEEKMALVRGASEDPATNQGQAGYLTGVPRLGIPPIRMSDGPPGVLTRLPSQAARQPAPQGGQEREHHGSVRRGSWSVWCRLVMTMLTRLSELWGERLGRFL